MPAGTPTELLTDWNLLRSLVAVVETGSLSQAALRLGTTQPSVSRHVRELERVVGETLFDRRPSGLVATPRAAALYDTVRGMQDLARRAEGLLADEPQRVAGLVRITTSQAFAVHVLPRWLDELMRAEPALEIELRSTDDIENLVRRDADVAVRFARPEQPGVIAKRVGQTSVGLFGSTAYLDRCGEPTTFEEGTSHLLIGPDTDPAPTDADGTALPPFIRFRLRTNSPLTTLAAVEAGMGLGPVELAVAQTRPQLRRVIANLVDIPLEIWLCSHEDLRRSARIRRVFDFLDERLSAAFGGGA